MRKVRTARLNGVKYGIDLDGNYAGLCSPPSDGMPEIHLTAAMENKRDCMVFLAHELLHGVDFKARHGVVYRTSEALGDDMWRKGWRWLPERRHRLPREDRRNRREDLQWLRLIIGEVLVACHWPKRSRDVVVRDIGLALWRVGYRRKL